MTGRRWQGVLVALLGLGLAVGNLPAARLDPTPWKLMEVAPLAGVAALKVLTDNDLATSLTTRQIGIDLGGTNTLDRVYLTGTNRTLQYWPHLNQTGTNPPLGLITVSVGNTWPPRHQVGAFTVPYDAGNPVDTEVDVRFNPTVGRYVLVQLQSDVRWGVDRWPGWALKSQPPAPSNQIWRVAELEIHGFNGVFSNQDAVVLAAPAPAPLQLAADDLSYYLGELAGRPVPVVTPAAVKRYPGNCYYVDDLKPLAPDYPTMLANINAGRLPANVNIVAQGRQVHFTAWPYRCVLWSVWEFLERQGVRWLYPDGQGDAVPAGRGVDLSFLPLHYAPVATSVYANWDTAALEPWPRWEKQSIRQSFLYPWRNHWNCSSSGTGPLGGAEIPALSVPGKLPPDYADRFEGYPHNFNTVVPRRILLEKGSNWWGYDATRGRRVAPGPENITFCLNNPQVIQWVAGKVVAVDRAFPPGSQHPLSLFHAGATYNLLPMDATIFCSDDQWCQPANGVDVPVGGAYVALYHQSKSGEYYHFVNAVAQGVRDQGSPAVVGALAYGDVNEPPVDPARFPDNVQVEVCLYGAPNLPVTSPPNARLKATWEAWHARCPHLATYDYALLHTDYWQPDPQMPVPLVSAIVDRADFLASLGALNGGCQASPESLAYNPWNFYAYPRVRWNPNQSPGTLLTEFFDGYFRECAAPMRAFYQSLEDSETTNHVNLHYMGYCYGITPGSFPQSLLQRLQGALSAAETSATNWVVRERVGRVRESFDWVLAQRHLTGASLADLSACPVVPASGIYTVNLAGLEAPQADARHLGGNYASFSAGRWCFYAHGTIQSTLNFKRAGPYQVTVTARAVPFENVFPVLNCYLGASEGSAPITSTNDQVFKFSLNVPSGAWDLLLDYHNAAIGGKRNLFISGIQITPQ